MRPGTKAFTVICRSRSGREAAPSRVASPDMRSFSRAIGSPRVNNFFDLPIVQLWQAYERRATPARVRRLLDAVAKLACVARDVAPRSFLVAANPRIRKSYSLVERLSVVDTFGMQNS